MRDDPVLLVRKTWPTATTPGKGRCSSRTASPHPLKSNAIAEMGAATQGEAEEGNGRVHPSLNGAVGRGVQDRTSTLPYHHDTPKRPVPIGGKSAGTRSAKTFQHELVMLVQLAVPTCCIQLGFTIPPFLTASYVGRTFGAVALDGFQLANLVCNLFTLSLLQGLYSASDTLSPQAYGAGNYREVGLIALRGFVASFIIVVPICVSLALAMERLLVWFGEDPVASRYAHQWYCLYILSLPFYVLYMVTWKFLSAQNSMLPLLLASVVSVAVVLPLALEFMTKWFGYLGTAMAIVLFQVSQASIALGYVVLRHPHRPGTWPGLNASVWRDVFHWDPFMTYFYLGLGGIIAASEWIYWETLSLAIGTLGVVPLSVHTVPTQVITVLFMIPLGLGIALAVRLGAALPRSTAFAKQLVLVTMVAGSALFIGIAVCLYWYRDAIFRFFIEDPDVLEGCEQIWWKVCLYYSQLGIYALNMGVAIGLGMQWTLGIITFSVLWLLGLPSAWYFGVIVYQSLDVTWHFIYPPYVLMNAALWWVFYVKDWEVVASEIREREGMESAELVIHHEVFESPTRRRSSLYGAIEERLALVEGCSR